MNSKTSVRSVVNQMVIILGTALLVLATGANLIGLAAPADQSGQTLERNLPTNLLLHRSLQLSAPEVSSQPRRAAPPRLVSPAAEQTGAVPLRPQPPSPSALEQAARRQAQRAGSPSPAVSPQQRAARQQAQMFTPATAAPQDYTPYVAVHFRNYDWVTGAMAPDSDVHITVYDGDGNVKGWRDLHTDGDGGFWGDIYFPDGNCCVDIAPGDTVEVTDPHFTVVVPVTDISGWVDAEVNTFWGHVFDASCPANVRAEIWTPYEGWGEDFLTDENCDFFYDFSPNYDVRVGQWVNLWYNRPDGNTVGSVFSVLRLNADIIGDSTWGIAQPGAELTLTLRDPDGNVKDVQTSGLNADNQFGLGFNADMLSGDTLEGEYNPFVSRTLLLTAAADRDADTVSGTAEPNVYLWLDASGHGQSVHREFWVDEFGQWSVWLGDEFDIQPGDQFWVRTENRDGHETNFNFGLPSVEAHYRNYDWVQGYMTANRNVHLILWTEGGAVVKGWRDVGAGGDGWFWADIYDVAGNCCADMAPGDTLELNDGVQTVVIPITDISGTVDSAANTFWGHISDAACPAQVRVEIWSPFEGWGEDILTDENCDYFYDFSPNYDVGIGQWVNIWHRRPDGNSLGAVFSELRLGVDQTGDWVWGIVAADATVNFTLRDPDGNVKAERQAVTKYDGFYSFHFEADLAFGDTLEGAYNPSASLPLALSAIPDVDTDAVSGTAVPGSYLWLDVWGPRGGAHREFVVDQSGEWSVSFAGEFDIRPGDEGYLHTEGRDGHETNMHFWLPFARLNYGWDWADGRAAPGAEVGLEVFRDGLLVATGYTVASGDAWFGIEPRDLEDQHFDLQPGDVGHIFGGGLDETITLIPVDGALDVDADTVFGQMHDAPFPAEGWVEVQYPDGGDWHGRFVDIEADGSYLADFSGEMDIQPHHQAVAWYIDSNGNYAGNVFYTPFLQANANISHDWVNGEASPPGAHVDVNVWRDGAVFATGQADSGWNYWFHADLWTLGGERADIRVGDEVEIIASNGHSAWLELIPIVAAPDPAGNTVSGQIQGGPLPVEVDIEVWTENGTGQTVTTDEFGNFFADLNPFDLMPGHSVAVWQRRPDGHRVGIVRISLRIAASSAWDSVWGETVPNVPVTVTVVTTDGLTGAGYTTSGEEGSYGTDIYVGDQRLELDIGDEVTVEAATYQESFVLPFLTAEADVDNDTVCGQAPPKGRVRVDVWEVGSEESYADEEGNYCVYVGDWVDLQPGQDGAVAYFDHQDYEFQVGWSIPPLPFIRINQSHDWVDGQTSPFATVWLTLYDSDGNIKGENTTVARDNGWFDSISPCEYVGCDIVVGDSVHAEFSDGVSRDAEVLAMTGEPDPDANTASGQVSGGVFPAPMRGEVWTPGGPAVDGATDEFGNYLLDFNPYDLLASHMVALWYFEPDGDQIGIVRATNFVRVYPSDDWLWGQTMPSVLVIVVLRDANGDLKGGASLTSDSEGTWGTQVFRAGQPVEIAAGDTVKVTAAGWVSIVAVPLIEALPDASHDLMFVTTDLPNTQLEVRWDSSPGAGDLQNYAIVTTDENGLGFVDFSGLGGLELGTDGNIYYYDANGNNVEPWWLARLDSVAPTVVYNNVDTEIAVYGTRFYDEPGEVMLGVLGGPPTIFLPRTFISDSEVRATVPAGTPPGLYFVETLFSDERIGFLTDALLVVEPILVDDPAYGITYDSWYGAEDPQASGGGYRAAEIANQTITHIARQASTSITFITYRGPDQGQAEIFIDGVSKGILDLYRPTPQYQYPKTYSGLPNGRHTIIVKVLGTKNPLSSGYQVRVDAFRVATTTTEDNSPAVKYTTWNGLVAGQALGGSLRYSAARNATVSFGFSGTQFTWIAVRAPMLGKAQVLVDGAPWGVVDLCNATVEWQYPVVVSGLSEGEHTAQILVLGRHSPGCTANNVVFDGFSVP